MGLVKEDKTVGAQEPGMDRLHPVTDAIAAEE
jgi:hypothetical protein